MLLTEFSTHHRFESGVDLFKKFLKEFLTIFLTQHHNCNVLFLTSHLSLPKHMKFTVTMFFAFYFFAGMDLLKHGESAYPADAWVEQQYMQDFSMEVREEQMLNFWKSFVNGFAHNQVGQFQNHFNLLSLPFFLTLQHNRNVLFLTSC